MKRFNIEEFVWFTILVLLDASVFCLIYTGKISFYIGKDVIKYMYFALIILSLITVTQVRNIFTSVGSISLKLKLIPITFALVIGVVSVNNLKTFKHEELNKDIKGNKINGLDSRFLYEHELDYNYNKENIDREYMENVNSAEKKETIVINENNPLIIDDIRINPEKYIGKELEIHGFVCKENYLPKDQFIIGRIIITCCAADSKVVGIVGEYKQISNLEEGKNIKAFGIIGVSTINDENNISHKIPILLIRELNSEE